MRKLGLLVATVGAVTVSAQTASDQAFLALLVETKAMKMAGMPEMEMPELPPGVQLPPGVVLPGQAMRSLNVRLWSPSIAPPNATASIAVPAGLKQGPKLDLELYRPTAAEGTGDNIPGFDPDKNPNFTIKIYWGSSENVREGQPKVITWKGLTPEQMAEMKKRAKEASAQGSAYFYKPNWTTGYWPTKKQPGMIAKDASLTGTYELTTNYTGNVKIDVPAEVNFMDAISLTSPNLSNEIDFNKHIAFEWKPIANALGTSAFAMGMEGQNTMIMWSSSEVYTDGIMGDMGFLQMAEVRDHVAAKRFMEGTATKMTIPAGIFKNADMAMMNMVSYGPGAALDKAQPLPRVQTKSSLNVMLGGKGMSAR